MVRTFLLTAICLLALLAPPTPAAIAATYYVRTDGGTDAQCTGLSDAAYPGSGQNQPCAWAHPFWALDADGAWKIQGSDTLVIGPGAFMLGFGAPNTGWCDAGGAFGCHLPPLPSGTAAENPTRILGAGWDSGCAAAPELWGTERPWQLLTLQGTSNAAIECLELTDHSACIESFCPDPSTGCDPSVRCRRDEAPYGTWAPLGIYASDSANVTLRNLDIHGLAAGGIQAGRISDWTVEDVRIAANGWSGWDGDLPEDDDSNSGTLRFTRWIVEWNGCGESYAPGDTPPLPEHCWEQELGGYGDGVGTGATGGDWIIEDSIFRHNTSDGLDLLYLRMPGARTTIRRSIAVGNAGNQFKISGSSTIVNSLAVGNCGFFAGKPFTEATAVFNHCRAGGAAIEVSLLPSNVANIVNSTVVGHGDVLVGADCDGTVACDGSEQVWIQNSALLGYEEFPPGSGDTAAMIWDPRGYAAGRIDYNVVYGVKNECGFGAQDVCSSPRFVDGNLEYFDGRLEAESPAIDNGLPVGGFGGLVPAGDLVGGARPAGAGVDRGAYERGAATSVPDAGFWPAWHDYGVVAAGSSSPPQSFTIRNNGTGSLAIAGIRTAGTDAADFAITGGDCSGRALGPGEMCSVEAVFRPTGGGRRAGGLSVATSDPDTPALGIALVGQGDAPSVPLASGSGALSMGVAVGLVLAAMAMSATGSAKRVRSCPIPGSPDNPGEVMWGGSCRGAGNEL
ncbi:MAG: choice-of-anchor D domain-containing protein [Candidatus Schekmanbacteria bacterium]|nr:choice-of-anchor D domain-containing protein [Candidatus Schekmanbacteria bacterium]